MKRFYIIFKRYVSNFLIISIFLTYFLILSMPACFLTLPFRSQARYHVIRRLIGFTAVLHCLFHSTEEKEKCMGQAKICKRELLTARHASQCKLPDGTRLKTICPLFSSMLGNRKITTATLARKSLEGYVARGCLPGVILWLKGLNENDCFTLGLQMKYLS